MAERRIMIAVAVVLAAVTGAAVLQSVSDDSTAVPSLEPVRQVQHAAPRPSTPSSIPSSIPSATPGSVAVPGCAVRYAAVGRRDGRFSATVRLEVATRVPAWRLTWGYPAGQQVTQVVGARWRQSGGTVTITGRDALRPERPATLRLAGRGTPAATAPTAVRLNGSRCSLTVSRPPATSAPTSPPTTTTTATSATTTATTTATTRTPTTASTTTASTTTASTTGTVLGTGRIQYGRVYQGVATFYGADGGGNCMFDAGGDLMVGAMNHTDYENSQACGAFVQVTGPKGTITVKIVDQCPECAAGHIDLSAQAFARIADPVAGIVPISWRLLSPDLGRPVSYRFKEGSSQWWCAVQVRDHRNPVRSLELLAGSTWRQLPRQDYNYFVSADGTGCGGRIRVTDTYGHQVTSAAPVAVRPGVVQTGPAQFGAPA